MIVPPTVSSKSATALVVALDGFFVALADVMTTALPALDWSK